jgi:hypothetical protein
VIEAPWLRPTSECQRFRHPPRPNNAPEDALRLRQDPAELVRLAVRSDTQLADDDSDGEDGEDGADGGGGAGRATAAAPEVVMAVPALVMSDGAHDRSIFSSTPPVFAGPALPRGR